VPARASSWMVLPILAAMMGCQRQSGRVTEPPELLNRLLLNAAESGKIDGVRGLLRRGASPNAIEVDTHDGDTALIVACRRNDILLARTLLEAGANPNLRQHGNWSDSPPLTACAAEGRDEIVRLLVEYGARVNVRVGPVYPGPTPLFWASDGGHVGTVKLLLANGATVDRYALSVAMSHGYVGIVSDLLQAGGDPRWTLESGRTVLQEAMRSRDGTRQEMIATVRRFLSQ
jgi:ankyrin repeat protein